MQMNALRIQVGFLANSFYVMWKKTLSKTFCVCKDKDSKKPLLSINCFNDVAMDHLGNKLLIGMRESSSLVLNMRKLSTSYF